MTQDTKLVRIGAALAFALGAAASLAAQGTKPEKPVTPKEIEKLKRQIEREKLSRFELVFDSHDESGDLNNRLTYWRYGARLYLNRGETTWFLTASRTAYATPQDVLTANGTNVGLGASRPWGDHFEAQLELGTSFLEGDTVTFNGLASLTAKPNEKLRYGVSLGRMSVDESFLSAVGLTPVVGPFALSRVGPVMENRLAVNGSYRFPRQIDLFAEAALGSRSGNNIGSNSFRRAGGGIGYNPVARGEEEALSLVRLSAALFYFGFDDDRFGFGGASLLDTAYEPVPLELLGSDGLPTVPTPETPGTGGYFSPHRFVSRLVRLDVRGKPSSFFEYRAGLFVGSQSYTGSDSRRAGGVALDAILHPGNRFSLPLSLVWDDVGPFEQHTFSARLVARF